MYNSSMSFHQQLVTARKKRYIVRKIVVMAVIVMVIIGAVAYGMSYKAKQSTLQPTVTSSSTNHSSSSGKPAPAASPVPNYCAGNTLSQMVLVSISKRHLWACDGTTSEHDSPVVTGMENLPADLTPPGTYHIYAKETNLYLNGSDSTGSWHDYVYYWMPWLSNQYGIYGFHDATWRKPTDFGNISPYSSNASHGCVELPLATAKWLYNWASIGTTVTVES
jgi:lipoprotein-anchoring transpeptidase ErfK/SrfK